MKEQENIRKELMDISPFLGSKLPKKDGFQVPANFFHNMQVDVLQQIKEETPEPKVAKRSTYDWRSIFSPVRIAGFASVLMLAVAGFYWLSNDVTEEVLAELSTEEAIAYISDNIEEFDSEVIIETTEVRVDEYELEDINTSDLEEFFDENFDQFDEALLEEYL